MGNREAEKQSADARNVAPHDKMMDVFGARYVYRGAYRPDDSRWVDPSRTRDKSQWPYSYDEFFIHGSREAKAGANGDYSDRLWQWDREKANRCWTEHVGKKRWDQARLHELSAFLTDYHGKPLKAVALAEGCNASNGYPYWVVWFRDAPSRPADGEAEGSSAKNEATA